MNKALKRVVSAVTAAAVSFSAMLAFNAPEMMAAATETTEHTAHKVCAGSVCTEGESCTHGDIEWTAWESSTALPTATGNYYLTQNVTVKATGSSFSKSSETEIKGDVVLCLNGKTVTNEATGSNTGDRIFKIPSGKSLTLCDCTGNGKLTGAVGETNANTRGAVEVQGTFNMYGGNISGNSTDGVYLPNGGKFNMYGGKISENDFCGVYGDGAYNTAYFTMHGGEITANKSTGVYMYRGVQFEMNGGSVTNHTVKTNGVGVIVGTSVEFVMNGGKISGNVNEDSYTGAGVCVYGTFTMNGGTICKNIIGSSGGGVYISNGGTFNFDGGEITGNKSTGNGWGGGIHVDGTLNMTGGVISDNQASYGGGVYVSSVGSYTHTAIISGGSIVGNSVVDRSDGQTARGGGILSQGGTLKLDGAVEVSGNTYNGEPNNLYVWGSNFLVDIGENFDIENSHIGVLSGESITCGANGHKYISSPYDRDVSAAFFSDTDEYILSWDTRTNQLKFSAEHTPGDKIEYTSTRHYKKCTYCSTWAWDEEHKYESKVTKPATCTEAGVKTLSCSVCGYEKTEDIAATGHEWSAAWTSDGTNHWHACTNAGCAEKDDSAAHTWDAGVQTKAPTCTAKGVKTYTCSVCKATKTEDIDALGHSYADAWSSDGANHWHACTRSGCIAVNGKAAHSFTDKKDGAKHWQECSVCKYIKNSAAHSWGSGTATTPPTCTEKGVRTFTCSCGEQKTEVIPATGHDWSASWSQDSSKHWYACANAGCDLKKDEAEHTFVSNRDGSRHWQECSECGFTKDGEPHVWSGWTLTDNPTEATEGAAERSCGCGAEETETVPALSDGSVWTKVKDKCVEPTEDSNGKDVYTSDFGEVEVVIPQLDHTHEWGGWDIVLDPTEDTKGTAERVCAKDNSHVERTAVPALSDSSVWTKVEDKCVEPTEDSSGKDVYTSDFGEVEVVIPQLDHTHEWGGWNIVLVPTEDKEGTAERVCAKDNSHAERTAVPALSDGSVWTKVGDKCVEPTEDSSGKDVYTSDYGEVEVVIPASPHTHDLTHVEGVPATETTEGIKAHWHCDCGKNFSDADGVNEIADITIPAIGHVHTLVFVPEIPATETAEGTRAHWHCTGCGRNFSDENGENEVSDDKLKTGGIVNDVQSGANAPAAEFATTREELIDAVLTPEEQKLANDGTDIKIIMTVEDATSTTPAEDKAAVETAVRDMKDHKLGQYLDVNLLKIIGEQQEKITETNSPITITFEVPAGLLGRGRTYTVVRVHGGETTLLRDMDSDPDTVTIKTDKFSTYALTYRERTSGSSSSGRPEPTAPSESYTDDSSVTAPSGEETSESNNGSESREVVPSEEAEQNVGEPETAESGFGETAEAAETESGTPTTEETEDSSETRGSDLVTEDSALSSEAADGESTPAPSENGTTENEGNPSTGIALSVAPAVVCAAALTLSAKRSGKKLEK